MITQNLLDQHEPVYFIHVYHMVDDMEKTYIYMVLPNPHTPNELHIYSYEPAKCIMRFIGIYLQDKCLH